MMKFHLRIATLVNVVVLAHNASRCLLCFANFKHRVVFVKAFSFTALAQVVVVAHGTHITNASDRIHVTTIAN